MLSTFQFKLSYQKTFQQISFSGYFLPFFTAYLLGRYLINQTLFSAKILPLVKIFLKLLTCTPYFASLFLLIVEAFIIRIQISRSVNFLLILKKEVVKPPFSLPTKWEENFKVSISECDNSITILIWMLRNRRSHRLPIERILLSIISFVIPLFVWFARLLWKVVVDGYFLALLDGSYIEADFLETRLPQIFYMLFDNRIVQSSGTSQKVLL